MEAAAATRALGEVADRERRGERAHEEAELAPGTVHLADAEPHEEHLHAHALQRADGPRRGCAGDAPVVPDHVPVGDAELAAAVAGEEHLEGAVGSELVTLHALREDTTREVVPL